MMLRYPLVSLKNQAKITSFLYMPVPMKGSFVVGMFLNTDLWVYEDKYPHLAEQSKLPSLQPFLETLGMVWHVFAPVTLMPFIPTLVSLLLLAYASRRLKQKKLYVFYLPVILNLLSLVIAIPAHMTRYVYPTMFIVWLVIPIFLSRPNLPASQE